MLHAAFVRSPHRARARARASTPRRCRTDASRCRRRTSRTSAATAARLKDQRVLADVARYVGDVVAAVAAADARQRPRGRGGWSASTTRSCPPSSTPSRPWRRARRCCTRRAATRPTRRSRSACGRWPGTNVCHRFRLVQGDVDAGFAEADVIVEETFRTPSAAHAPMEPHATLGRVGRTAGSSCGRAPRRRSTCAPTSPACSGSTTSASASSRRRWAARSAPRPSCALEARRRLPGAQGAAGRSRRCSTAPRSS